MCCTYDDNTHSILQLTASTLEYKNQSNATMHFLLKAALLLCHLIFVPNFFVLAQVKPFYNHSDFLNYGEKKKPGGLRAKDYLENSIFKSKIDVLGEVFKTNIDVLKASPKLDLVFLIDGSSSVGEANFKSELKFVKKLLSDVTVDYDHARVAVVTFSSASSVIKSVDEITVPRRENNKCLLLNKQLISIEYKGGETYTLGAFELANKIFENSRNESKKVVFLITDGFSNGGDPVPLAAQMKKNQITIFTIGIRNGNYRELYELSSSPGEFHSYLLDSFEEFESLARRALHVDLKSGDYIPLGITSPCNDLCETGDCCDRKAWCSCGTSTGHYSCMCLPGYYGSGLKNSCLPCPAGTYADGPNLCLPCPDIHHTTTPPAYGIESCKCKTGFQPNLDNQCEIVKCPKVSQPEHGYFVKKRDCDNVLNSACGIRCEVGYTLSGNSIRLCQNDATWSGEQPSCQVKTCSKLQQPAYGSMVCAHPDLGITYDANETALPVDTVCSFKCEDGKTLIGSKHRTCLPLARWDGLKTSCKQIKCPKLAPIQHGRIDPLSCTIGKQPFGKKCKILCDQGYQTEGPSEKSCTGNHGLWDTKYENTICKDLIPPSIECPGNMTASAQLGQQYGIAVWKHPEATDNADLEVSFWMKPVIENITTYQFPIGQTKITYFAQDAYQNQANCSFFITVIDEERPVIEDCEDPPTFLTSERGGANVTWDEPNIYDNSQNVTINKTHEYGLFPFGTTSVTYTAVDGSGNKNVCVMNITVEDVHCEALPDPIYGHSECSPEDDGMQCVITCQEGYAVPLSQPQGSLNDSNISFMCNDAESIWYNHEGLMFPECSVTEVPKHVEQSGIVSVTSDMDTCNDTTEVENDVRITLQETSCSDNCTVTLVSDCEDEESIDEEKTNIIKREISTTGNGDNNKHKRGKKRKRVNVMFQVYGKYSNETQENINIYGNYNVSIKFQQAKYICPDGFVARKNRCVRCPKGTFNNATMKSKCQSCPYGYYNDQFGQTECKPCPLHHSTRRIHSKKREDCREQCPPGTHARKKITKQNKRSNTTTTERTTLQPRCRSCAIGYYQPNYNQLRCISCPKGYTTPKTGATAKTHCTPFHQNTCVTYPQICNGGKCIPKGRYYSCSCPQGYLGSHCERKLDHCESNPCLNGAVCENSAASFRCLCRAGFVGRFCEDLQEICPTVCLNGGKCYQNDIDDYFCTCPDGFGGETCELRMRLCQSNLCENNATCVEDSEGFRCKCKDGYIGRRCNILPCDYRPCPGHSICVNTMDRNATKNSFKCVCPKGFTGKLCEEKLDPCSENPCFNDGECINNGSTFSCVCSKLFQGQKCESKRTSKYVLNFSKFSLEDYVKLTGFPNNITEITACLWMQTKDNFNYGTLMSYATKDYDNAFTLTDYTGLVLYINNQYTVTDVLLNDGLWHHICVSWENSKGAYRLYVDGKTVKSGSGLASGAVIEGKGNMVIGQEQDVLGGKFSQSETYLGKMAYIDVWSRELHRDEMVLHMNDCQDLILGDVYAWPEIQENVQGNVQIENSSFCGSCSEPKSVYNGLIDVVDNVAYYECYKGYKLSGADYSSGRRCTKAAKWEGLYEPFCKRVSCGYPGYVRNSYTIGNSYLYQDKVVFQCHEGYNLTGSSTVTCLENGTWYPEKPQCAGAQCMAFKKPPGTNLVVIAEHSYEDFIENLTTFDVGTQVELTCTDEKANLTGENVITCQENGTWDFEPPRCVSPSKTRADSCDIKKIPAPPDNGYVEIGSFYTIGNGTGNTVEYKCRNGYELIGEDTSTCIIDGYWTEPNITCNPITCVLPKFKNMMIANEEIQKEVYQFGNMIKFDCKDGFRIFGDNTVRCLANKKWSRMKAKCTKKSCRKPEVKDTTIIEGNSYFFEDQVTIICSSKSRYVLNCNSFSMWIGERDESC